AILRDDVSVGTGLDTFRWVPMDISGDGRRDYVYVQPDGNQTVVHALVSQLGGGFSQSQQHLAPDLFGIGRQVVRGWKAMDVDGDGRTDLVYAHCAGITSGNCILSIEV